MEFDFSKYDLIICDCDDTLYEMDSLIKLPWTSKLIAAINLAGIPWVIASNQGGPACREAGWSTSSGKYPTLAEVEERFARIQEELAPDKIYLALAFYSKKSKMWCFPMESFPNPNKEKRCDMMWRKPWPGMIERAREDFFPGGYFSSYRKNVLMIGDSEDDEGAARNAGCDFINVLDLVKEMGIG